MEKKWFRLDTAALIFPVIRRRDWSNVFRLSATLRETVDPELLQQAVDELRPRFPSFYVSLHTGVFWHYLEECRERVIVREDYSYPLTYMSRDEARRSCLRVYQYKNRIAVEFFHVLTDGRGGSIYLRNLLSRYLTLRYGIRTEPDGIIKDLKEAPRSEELEDSFLKNAAPVGASRRESSAYRLHGWKEPDARKHLICGIIPNEKLLEAAHRYGVSVTAFLSAVMVNSIMDLQAAEKPLNAWKPVKVTIPVDLRQLYGSETLRNFSLVVNVGVDPRYGQYTLQELCSSISHQLKAAATPQAMAGMIAANVLPQRMPLLQATPIGLKAAVMEGVYRRSGETGGCINISNLGNVDLPESMQPYVERMEFIIGPQRSYPNNCSVLSCGGKTYINMIRNIRQSELERRFFSSLVEEGLPVEIESNER